MAVTVVTKTGASERPESSVVVEEADRIELGEGGHLLVKKHGGTTNLTLAVFAPSRWVSAYKDNGAAFR